MGIQISKPVIRMVKAQELVDGGWMDGELLNVWLEPNPGAQGRPSQGKVIKLGAEGGVGVGQLNRKGADQPGKGKSM